MNIDESDRTMYFPLFINQNGNIDISGFVFKGRKIYTNLEDITGIFSAEDGTDETLALKEDGTFTIADNERNAYSGKYSVLPCYNLVFYRNGKEAKYELVPGDDFLLLSQIIFRR